MQANYQNYTTMNTMEIIDAIEQLWKKTRNTPGSLITFDDIIDLYDKGDKKHKKSTKQKISDTLQAFKKCGIKIHHKHKKGFRLSEEYNDQNNPFYIFREGYEERRKEFQQELLKELPYDWASNITKKNAYPSKKILMSDRITNLNQISILPDLLYAVKNQKPIKLEYRHKFGDSHDVFLHPAFIKEFSGRWYVCGIRTDSLGNTIDKKGDLTNDEDKNQVYAIDRIANFNIIQDGTLEYIQSEDNYWIKYFENLYGIWHRHTEPKEIIIETQNKTTYHRLLTKPIHKIQKEIQGMDKNFKARFSITVIPNRELTSILMSYREKIKVIGPEDYLKEFLESVKSTLKLYGYTFDDDSLKVKHEGV